MIDKEFYKLYQDLFANSPQTVTMDSPGHMGTGKISQVVTRQGAVLSDWHMKYDSDMSVCGVNSDAYIQMLFCLKEGCSWNIADERKDVTIRRGETCIYRGHGKMEYLCYLGRKDFAFRNIKIPITYFRNILQDYFDEPEISLYEKKLLTGISKVEITPYMERILAELKDFAKYRGGLGYLFLESKVFEMLSVYLSEVLELNILRSPEVSISKSDRDTILDAKRIIDHQLASAPGCEELARKVGISASKLTKGFSSMFGVPIHTYIIDQRLEKAAGMLIESSLNVGQIALAVGYSKPGNFSAAFKRKYGVNPKCYKGQEPVE